MLLLKARVIEYPEYHKVYSIRELGNFIDYRRIERDKDAHFRLQCLMRELDENGMTHPIILSPTIAHNVSVGHQRVWYAKQNNYTHIDCYEVPNQTLSGDSLHLNNKEIMQLKAFIESLSDTTIISKFGAI